MEPTPKPPKALTFDAMSPEDIAKVKRLRGADEQTVKVSPEDLILAEFALFFGWEAYKDARDDVINIDEMNTLIAAARKLEYFALYNRARATYIGAGSVQTKNPGTTFKKMTDSIIKQTKADE